MTTKYELFFLRIKKAANCKTDTQLAVFFGINKSTLSMWKKRERVDYDILFTKLEHLDIDLNWLLKGKGFISEESEESKIDRDKIDILRGLFGSNNDGVYKKLNIIKQNKVKIIDRLDGSLIRDIISKEKEKIKKKSFN
jgi:transcriptional regulator with XRE-family HTH domain